MESFSVYYFNVFIIRYIIFSIEWKVFQKMQVVDGTV